MIRRVSIERLESEALKPQVLHGGGPGGNGCGLSMTAEPRGLSRLPAASQAVEPNTTTPIVATVATRTLSFNMFAPLIYRYDVCGTFIEIGKNCQGLGSRRR